MILFDYQCGECGVRNLSLTDIGNRCMWCKGHVLPFVKALPNGIYLGETDEKVYTLVHLKGERLIILPPKPSLLRKARCAGVDEILPLDIWPGKIIIAHPNSFGSYV